MLLSTLILQMGTLESSGDIKVHTGSQGHSCARTDRPWSHIFSLSIGCSLTLEDGEPFKKDLLIIHLAVPEIRFAAGIPRCWDDWSQSVESKLVLAWGGEKSAPENAKSALIKRRLYHFSVLPMTFRLFSCRCSPHQAETFASILGVFPQQKGPQRPSHWVHSPWDRGQWLMEFPTVSGGKPAS